MNITHKTKRRLTLAAAVATASFDSPKSKVDTLIAPKRLVPLLVLSARKTNPSRSREFRSRLFATCRGTALLVVMIHSLPLAQPTSVMAQGYHQTIIQTGDPLPGTTGLVSDLFTGGANRNGQVSFIDGISSNPADIGVYLSQPGSTQQIARIGQPILNGLGNLDAIFGTGAFLSQEGRVGFVARGAGAGLGANDTFLFMSNGSGGLTTMAREGDAAGGNGQFGAFSNGSGPVMAGGQMYFSSVLTGTSGGTANDFGIYRSNGTTTTELVREGNSAAGNGTFSIFNRPSANNQNQITFRASLIGTSGGTADDRGIFRTDGISLVQIVRESQVAPDGNGIFSEITTSGPPINQAGQVAFASRLSGTAGIPGDTIGIFRGQGGAVTQIARGGTLAPEGNGTITGFANSGFLDFNDNGQVLYHGLLANTSGGTADDQGLYLADGLNTINIVREGQSAAGNGFFVSPGGGHVNNIDTVLFSSFVAAIPGGSTNVEGIFMGDGTEIVEAMRSGDTLGNSTILFAGAIRDSFNDDGQFVYQANLANGKKLIGRFTPELHYRTATSGNWDDRINWTVGIKPNGVHDVFIDSNSNVNVFGPVSDVAIRSLQVGGGAGQSTLVLQDGEIAVDNQVHIASNGTLAGSGQINGTTIVDGTISPGNSTGVIGFQGFLDLNPAALLEFELGGLLSNQFDRISIIGNAELDGTLSVDLVNGFTLSDGDEFLIVQATGAITGNFLNLSEGALVGRFGNQDLFITYNAGSGDVGLFSRLSAVPEPASASLIGLVGAFALLVRRKRIAK